MREPLTGVDAEIEPRPGPCWERRRLVERRSLQALRRVARFDADADRGGRTG